MDFDRDFGINQVFVEDLYEQWRQNPSAVDETWNKYFSTLAGVPLQTSAWVPQPAQGNGAGLNGNGAAFHGNGSGANGNHA
ncbi:MAG: hypothetical protein JST92_05010, partial [Deltaproteobacteria bacterium]|nr:hypothetical protein [Deltaproteobacteria bacterium]